MTTTPPSSDDAAHVRAVAHRSNSSFLMGMRLLSGERRAAMYAVYAFCREVDDIADEPGPLADKRARLEEWRGIVESLYAGSPAGPVGRALQPAVERYGLRKEDFLAIIDGMEMDAVPGLQFADMRELALYCDRVACAVGRLSIRVFGAIGAGRDASCRSA